MISKSKIIVILAALTFSLGIFSVGFGYWTDQLNLEGDANVRLSINVTDDIIKVEYTTPDAVQLMENQIAPDDDGIGEDSSNSSTDFIVPDPVSEPPTDSSVPEDTEQNESDGTSTTNDADSHEETTNPALLNSNLVPDSTEQTGSQDNSGGFDSSSGTGETTTKQTSPNNDGAGEGSIEE